MDLLIRVSYLISGFLCGGMITYVMCYPTRRVLRDENIATIRYLKNRVRLLELQLMTTKKF